MFKVRHVIFSLLFSYENANTKKEALTMEFPLTLIDSLLNYGTSTMLKNGTLYFRSPIFNTT
jgi:hypothetical protein